LCDRAFGESRRFRTRRVRTLRMTRIL